MHRDWSKKNPYWLTVAPDAEYPELVLVVVDIFRTLQLKAQRSPERYADLLRLD
jgi:hypothetical protein